ncbi:ras GTPase-activating protein nGAP-like isoform X2 [Patiria miniata]|uniref:Ras GTPase-activating protein nGAP n=1 Tax=Patiria miniata TaxID=46514 RepID=A0A914AHY8_PATMI|nr:ras GTPase-activating protein nGAP-like isoform X2 [Patiria miniata]
MSFHTGMWGSAFQILAGIYGIQLRSNAPKLKDIAEEDVNQDGVGRARRKSAPSTGIQMTTDASGQQSKFSGIFPKRMKIALKRTKSVGKFDKHATLKEEDEESDMTSPHSIKPSHSHESLLLGPQTSLDVFDLSANDLVILPLHSSILGQDHCFQITNSLGKKYYSCRSASERDKWMESIRSAVHPEKDNKRRKDSVLRLWVVEGKNVPLKRKYYCEICLDDTLYARTTAKSRGDMVFWGEQFLFTCLPEAKSVKVHLYKEPDKKKRRDKNYIGVVSIPLDPISNRATIEKWYPLTNTSTKGDTPSLRIKARYQSISILPIAQYSELAQYLKENAVSLCQLIEQQINVKTKEEIATSLIKVLHCLGLASEFLVELVMTETRTMNDESLVFRANTMATKSMEAYMKLIGGKYLQDTIGDFVHTIYENEEDCEVDPTKVSSSILLQQHQATLTMLCEMACCKIVNSAAAFPSELRAVFNSFSQHSQNQPNGQVICEKLISGCIFLRFLCPAIMSPSLFDLIQEYPSEKTSRCLTLIAKTVQGLANFTKFGTKESYMVFMNEFLEREWCNMKTFLQEISSTPDKANTVKFNGYTDLGKELSLLHSLLVETLDDCEKLSEDKVGPLKSILARITSYSKLPEGTIPYSSSNFIQMVQGSSSTTVTMTSTATSPMGKKSLNKIFDDAKLSDSTDVEMLPPYNIAMERSITSSTVNNLVDFIQQDNTNLTNGKTELSTAVFEIGNTQTDATQIESSTTVEQVRTTTEYEERIMEELEGDMVVSMTSETKKSVNQSYSVSLERSVAANPAISTNETNRTTLAIDRNAGGDARGKRRNRTLPLSFQNPAYLLSKKSLRHLEVGASDSVSSSNSSPSNSDGASSNHDGDVSQNSSSCGGVSPPMNRKTASSKGPSSSAKVDIMAHTLPKAAHRSHNITSVDLYPKVDRQIGESQSSSAINANVTKPQINSSYSSTSLFDPARTQPSVTSPTEAIRAMNNAAKAAFFSSVIAPGRESPNPSSQGIRSPTSSGGLKQRSQAILHINNDNHQPSFAVTFTNPKPESQTAHLGHTHPEHISSSSPSISPPTSSPTSVSSEDLPARTLVRTEAVIQTGTSAPQSTQSTESVTFTTQRFMSSQTILPTSPCRPKHLNPDASPTSRTPLMGTTNLEKNLTPRSATRYPTTPVLPSTASISFSISNLTPSMSAITSPTSPSSLPLPRKKIMTQFASKPRICQSESSSSSSSLNKPTENSELSIQIGKKIRSLSLQHNFTSKPIVTSPPGPVWTRRMKDPSSIDRETQTEVYSLEIQILKDELEKVTLQLEETQLKLEEEEVRADKAIAEMKVELDSSQTELRKQHEDKDKQIKDIITRLVTVEEELKKEQEEMVAVVSAKQKIIEAQEKRIESLDAANVRLMRALDQLKERYQLTRRSKSSSDIRTTAKLTPLKGSMKSTNC